MLTSTVIAEMNHKTMCWREAGDCTVKAIAIALDICYAESWYATRKCGRGYRKGMCLSEILATIHSKGKDTVALDFKGSAVQFMQYYPTGSYLIEIKNHIMAYKDGVLHDDATHWKGEIYSIHHILEPMKELDFETKG